LPLKAEIDGFQGTKLFQALTEVVQTLIFDFLAAMNKSVNPYSRRVTYPLKLKMIDCREPSLSKHPTRFFRL